MTRSRRPAIAPARRRSAAHRIALFSAALAVIPACADLLGASGYEDAVELLCTCSSTLPDCQKTLNAKLAVATPEAKAEWLALYQEKGCDTADCKTDALECFYKAPGVCAPAQGECARSEGCCDFDFDKPEEGGRCCATARGSDSGVCCDTCITCAQALGLQTPDVKVVCVSHLPELDAVLTCKEAACAVQCAVKDTCDSCLALHCKSQIDTCNAKKAP